MFNPGEERRQIRETGGVKMRQSGIVSPQLKFNWHSVKSKYTVPHCLHSFVCLNRDRILERNWDKSLKNFPPCYSQLPLLTDFIHPLKQKWFETGF